MLLKIGVPHVPRQWLTTLRIQLCSRQNKRVLVLRFWDEETPLCTPVPCRSLFSMGYFRHLYYIFVILSVPSSAVYPSRCLQELAAPQELLAALAHIPELTIPEGTREFLRSAELDDSLNVLHSPTAEPLPTAEPQADPSEVQRDSAYWVRRRPIPHTWRTG